MLYMPKVHSCDQWSRKHSNSDTVEASLFDFYYTTARTCHLKPPHRRNSFWGEAANKNNKKHNKTIEDVKTCEFYKAQTLQKQPCDKNLRSMRIRRRWITRLRSGKQAAVYATNCVFHPQYKCKVDVVTLNLGGEAHIHRHSFLSFSLCDIELLISLDTLVSFLNLLTICSLDAIYGW